MRSWKRREFLRLGAVGLGAAAVGVHSGRTRARASRPLRVGASLPFTGRAFFVDDGLHQYLGYRLWAEQVNAAGGLLGRTVELVVHDDGASADGAAAAYRRLIERDRVDLLLGNYSSGMARATIPVVEQAGIPCLFPMAWKPSLWSAAHRWAAPLLPPANVVTRPLVEYLAHQGVKRVAVVNADNAYATDLADGMLHWLREQSLEMTGRFVYDGTDEAGLGRAVMNAAATRPDAIAGGNVGDQIPALAQAAKALTRQPAHYAWFELDEPVILGHRARVEGMDGFGLWLPEMAYPGNRRFVRDFVARWESEYPDTPVALLLDHHSAAGYGAAQVLAEAVQAAGSTQPAAVRDALFSLHTSTVFGPYRLDGHGVQAGKTVPVVGYRHGVREVLWPPELRNRSTGYSPGEAGAGGFGESDAVREPDRVLLHLG